MGAAISEFDDPGDCLRFLYSELKKEYPGASHRYIAKSVGLRSSASLTLIIKGRLHPSPQVIDALAKVFGLDRVQRNHLSILFEIRKMKDPAAREILLAFIKT